jgi:hypothetical protein
LFVLFLIVYSVPDETRRLLCPQCSSAQLSSGPPAKRSRGGMQTDEDQAWKAPFQSADQRFHSAAQTYLKLILSSSGEISYSIYFCTYFSHICANVCSRAGGARGAAASAVRVDTAARSDSESDPDSPASKWRKRLTNRWYGPDADGVQKKPRTTGRCMYGDLSTLDLSRLYV